MKRLYHLFFIVLFAVSTGSCASARVIKPGDKIGEMTIEQGSLPLIRPSIWQFCEYMAEGYTPVKSKSDCEVPMMSGVTITFGWLAKESKLAANWEAMSWDLSLDGNRVDLETFKWEESDYPTHGENNKDRGWYINLKNPTPGKHTLRLSWTSKLALDDGFNIYQPGTYEHVVNFTITESAAYPVLSSTVNIGQHPYTSQKAGLDFLLYLPSDYGRDPQQEWPLLVYLHGAPVRGATLELLSKESLPYKLDKDTNLPFIVVSPLGDGEYEFWAKDEMITPLFALLEEIQDTYSVDAKRIYLTGNDMGGNGVWVMGLRHPEYFAALVPLAGYASYPFAVPENICDLKSVPVWAFHGERDPYVPVEAAQDLIDALVACGGNAQITLSSEMKNDVPLKVYDDPELYDWLLEQKQE